MNTINNNNNNVNFGIAFKVYTNNRGVRTADLLDAKEELALYKNLNKKLKADKFIKTDLGLKSENTTVVKRDYQDKKGFTVKNANNEYYADNSFFMSGNGLKKAFGKVKAVFESIKNN